MPQQRGRSGDPDAVALHEPRVRRPGFRRRHILDPMAFPETVGAAKGLQATLGADSCPALLHRATPSFNRATAAHPLGIRHNPAEPWHN
jgi:hypothetical protein